METLASLTYLVSAVLFILALRGLSHPESARQGLNFGMSGMAIAIVTTMLLPSVGGWFWIILGVGIGGVIGAIVLALLLPVLRPVVLSFGPAEFFLLAILGITFIAALKPSSDPPVPHRNNAKTTATKPIAPKTRCPVMSISIMVENIRMAIIS